MGSKEGLIKAYWQDKLWSAVAPTVLLRSFRQPSDLGTHFMPQTFSMLFLRVVMEKGLGEGFRRESEGFPQPWVLDD